jgi:polysaccharide biosynthesis transport protein
MEDEIDLRAYLDVLLRRWKWIVGVTLVAALVAGVVSLLMPPTYESTASVFVLSTGTTSTGTSTNQVLVSPQAQVTLLTSNLVAQQVIQALGDKLSEDEKRALLSTDLTGGAVKVQPDTTDKSLFKITAQAKTAEKSQDIANAWATAGAAEINDAQNQGLGIALPTLQQAADAGAKEYQTAEDNLNRKRRDLQIDILSQQLARIQSLLNNQFAEREGVKSALAQAQALKTQVQQGQISVTTEMLLNLQSISTGSGSSYLVQPGQFASPTKQQQLDQLDAVIAALTSRQQALGVSIDSVTNQVETLQTQLNEKQVMLTDVTVARDAVKARYDATIAQLRSSQLASTVRQDPARALTLAVPPESPVSPKKTQNVAIAAVVGLMAGVLGAFGVEYFAAPRKPRAI